MKTLLHAATKRLTDIAKTRGEISFTPAKKKAKSKPDTNAPDGLDNQTVETTSAAAGPVLANTGLSTAAA